MRRTQDALIRVVLSVFALVSVVSVRLSAYRLLGEVSLPGTADGEDSRDDWIMEMHAASLEIASKRASRLDRVLSLLCFGVTLPMDALLLRSSFSERSRSGSTRARCPLPLALMHRELLAALASRGPVESPEPPGVAPRCRGNGDRPAAPGVAS